MKHVIFPHEFYSKLRLYGQGDKKYKFAKGKTESADFEL